MTTSEFSFEGNQEALASTASRIQSLVESLIDLGVLVHDNQGTVQSQNALTQKTNQVVSQLSGLTDSPFTRQYPIPVDVLTYIEDGRNPDIYTREFVEVTAKFNAKLKGKMTAFSKLQDILGAKLVEEFPHLKEGVDDVSRRTKANTDANKT